MVGVSLVEEGDGVVAGFGDAAVFSFQGVAGAHQVFIRAGTAVTVGMGSHVSPSLPVRASTRDGVTHASWGVVRHGHVGACRGSGEAESSRHALSGQA